MAEDGESSLDHAFAKVCDIFGFEKLNKHQEEAIQQIVEMKRDVYVNLPTGYGKSVVFKMCKMGLTGLHDSYGSWHLYICRFLFGLSTFLSLRIICVIRRKKSR